MLQVQSLRQLGHMAHAIDDTLSKESDPEKIKKLTGYREHIQLMRDMTIKMALLDRQITKLEENSEQRSQLKAIRGQLDTSLQTAYQEIQKLGKSDPIFKEPQLKARLQTLAVCQNTLYPSPATGATLSMPATQTDSLQKRFTLSGQDPPTITAERSLNPKTEKHYIVQYADLPPLDVMTRLNQDKNHELKVTAQTDENSTTLDPAILAQIIKIAQNTKIGSNTTIEVIAPNAEQALRVAIALKTAGLQPNLDGFNNGNDKIAFNAEAKAKINAIDSEVRYELSESRNDKSAERIAVQVGRHREKTKDSPSDESPRHVGGLLGRHRENTISKKTDSLTQSESDTPAPPTRPRGKTI